MTAPALEETQEPKKKTARRRWLWYTGGCLTLLLVALLGLLTLGVVFLNRLFPAQPLAEQSAAASEEERAALLAKIAPLREDFSRGGEIALTLSERECNVAASFAQEREPSLRVLEVRIDGDRVDLRFSAQSPQLGGRFFNVIFRGRLRFENGAWQSEPELLRLGEEDLLPGPDGQERWGVKPFREKLVAMLRIAQEEIPIELLSFRAEDGSMILSCRQARRAPANPAEDD
ncbi:MAG: hypothetical protein V1918_08490 [Planctomycetota bacterium]